MTASQLEGAVTSALTTLENWDQFQGSLLAITGPDDSKFDLSVPIPSVAPPVAIEELGQKLGGCIALVQEFSEIETTVLIPDATITELLGRVGAVRATSEKLLGQVQTFDPQSKVLSLDPVGLLAANELGQQINLGPTLAELYPLLQSLLVTIYQLRSMAGLSGKGGLALELTQIHAARSAQRRALGELNRLTRQVEKEQRQLASQIAETTTAQSRISTLEAQAKKDIEQVTVSKQRAEELINSATVSSDAASKLKEAVEAYSKSFATFQNDLDTRNTDFAKGKAGLEALLKESEQKRDTLLNEQTSSHRDLIKKIEANEQEIQLLLARSKAMLGEATVAGLSSSFANEMTQAGNQLWWMQILFFVSVGLLLLGAGIILDAFPWLSGVAHIAKLDAPVSGEPLSVAVYLLANFLRTLTFLLAPLILLIYAARRITELFRMKAHYTYKFTVAASLPGFKLEAPTYAEAITASAFEELLFNPGASVGKPEDNSVDKGGNTFVQRLIEPIVKRAMDKMGELPK